jgi:predicted RNA-binding Zn ribbon-like protein
VLPGEPVPVRLMNTIWADRFGVHDALTRPADLGGWLVSAGLLEHEPDVRMRELSKARQLRDALRRLAALQTGDSRPAAASPCLLADAVDALNATAVAATPRLQQHAGHLRLAPTAPGIRGALARVAADAIGLLTAPDPSLGACQAPGCVLYFVKDHPRREWCSSTCGNRARAARHYSRHRATPRQE